MRNWRVNTIVALVGINIITIINFTYYVQTLHCYLLTKIFCVYLYRFCGFQSSTSPAKFITESNVAFVVFKSVDEYVPTNSTANLGFTLHFEASEHFSFLKLYFPYL